MGSLSDVTTLLNTIIAFITAVAACFATLSVFSARVRNWFKSRFGSNYGSIMEQKVTSLKDELVNINHAVADILTANNKQNENIALIKEATLCELRDTLTHMYYAAEKVGEMSHYNKENFEKMYQAYTTLGGNSYVHEIRDKVIEMPTIQD